MLHDDWWLLLHLVGVRALVAHSDNDDNDDSRLEYNDDDDDYDSPSHKSFETSEYVPVVFVF
jgi:hypothetical protein